MTLTIQSPRHKLLTKLICKFREDAGLTQGEVAKALGRYQSYIANVESGQRRIDVVEFLDLASAIGFDANEALQTLIAATDKAGKSTSKNPGSSKGGTTKVNRKKKRPRTG